MQIQSLIDDDEPITDPPPEKSPEQAEEWATILDAPDITQFITRPRTKISREYQVKVQSALKAGLQFRLAAPEGKGLPDAAAILAHGPNFALRAGELADYSPQARQVLDMITSPDNPWFMFALAGLPFIAQLFRNHEDQVRSIPGTINRRRKMTKEERKAQPRAEITLPIIHRKIRVPFKLRFSLAFLRTQTQNPQFLTHQVFGDPKICDALYKAYGIRVTRNGSAPDV